MVHCIAVAMATAGDKLLTTALFCKNAILVTAKNAILVTVARV